MWDGSAWTRVGTAIGGKVYISDSGGVQVNFPPGSFSTQPSIEAVPYNSAVVVICHVSEADKDGFLLRAYTLSDAQATTCNASWIAVPDGS